MYSLKPPTLTTMRRVGVGAMALKGQMRRYRSKKHPIKLLVRLNEALHLKVVVSCVYLISKLHLAQKYF